MTRPALLQLVLLAIVTSVLSAQTTDDRAFVPVTDALLQNPAPEDWLMWRRTLNGWGYSPLDQINRDNVDRLRLARWAPVARRARRWPTAVSCTCRTRVTSSRQSTQRPVI